MWDGWSDAFNTGRTLDILAAYPIGLFTSYRTQLRQFVAEGKKVRVILADPDAKGSVAELAQRFGHAPDYAKSQIQQIHKDFTSLSDPKNAVELRKAAGGHPIKLVLFDNQCLLITYSLRPSFEAPALVGKKGGQLYAYVREEFEAAWSSAKV